MKERATTKVTGIKAKNPLRRKAKNVTPRKALEVHLDEICSLLVRARGKCDKCGKQATWGKNGRIDNLFWAHIIGRREKRVRWESKNAMCLCFYCHSMWWHGNETDPREIVAFVEAKWPGRWQELDTMIADRPPQWGIDELREMRDRLYKKLQNLQTNV